MVEKILASVRTNRGPTLDELSRASPVLVVFLRHSGCTFCREALDDVAAQRRAIEANGTQIVLVHMSDDASAQKWMAKYGLDDVHRVSDPDRNVYRAFDLQRGRIGQLLGPRIWGRGFVSALVARRGFGPIRGDAFQLPGAFLLRDGKIVRAFRHATAADRPNYEQLACSLDGAQ